MTPEALKNVQKTLKVNLNQTAFPTNELGSEVKKSVRGLELVHVSHILQHSELREGTTGRSFSRTLPRIMAVADTAADQTPVPAETALPNRAVQPEPQPELAFYRKYTEAMLRRYLRLSMEVGRVPSVMGRELFRGNVSHCKVEGLEDAIVFCVDVERCIARLRKEDQRILQRIAIQGYTQEQAAPMLGICLRTCIRHYGEALDRLTELFLKGRLLEPQKMLSRP